MGIYAADGNETFGISTPARPTCSLSPLFRDTLAGVSGATIELYDTDGSVGAARGAGIGAGIYKDNTEAFATLDKLQVIEPDEHKRKDYLCAYTWPGKEDSE